MSDLWPCDECTKPGVANLGNRGYCIDHLGALYARFDPANLPLNRAFGYTTGPQRPDFGIAYADLSCCRCAATWTGVPGEQCWWCLEGQEQQVEHQAELLLRLPERWLDDDNRAKRMAAWAKRMVVGINAGIITEPQARRAWQQANRKETVR